MNFRIQELLFCLLLLSSTHLFSQTNLSRSVGELRGEIIYDDSSKYLRINCGQNGEVGDYYLDSTYLKYREAEQISIWLELDNESNVIIDADVLPKFENLRDIELIRKNHGEIFLPTDLNMCSNLASIYIDLGIHSSEFRSIPKPIKNLETLEHFAICLSKRLGNRQLLKDIEELMLQSSNLKSVHVVFKNRDFKRLRSTARENNILFNN